MGRAEVDREGRVEVEWKEDGKMHGWRDEEGQVEVGPEDHGIPKVNAKNAMVHEEAGDRTPQEYCTRGIKPVGEPEPVLVFHTM